MKITIDLPSSLVADIEGLRNAAELLGFKIKLNHFYKILLIEQVSQLKGGSECPKMM